MSHGTVSTRCIVLRYSWTTDLKYPLVASPTQTNRFHLYCRVKITELGSLEVEGAFVLGSILG